LNAWRSVNSVTIIAAKIIFRLSFSQGDADPQQRVRTFLSKKSNHISSASAHEGVGTRFSVPVGILLSAVLDLIGEPPINWHPVVWYGKLIGRLEQAAPHGRLAQLLYGVLMPICAATLVLPPILLVQFIIERMRLNADQTRWKHLLPALIEGGALKPFFALRMLVDAGRGVRRALECGDLPAARLALQNLVSRDRSCLTADLAVAATIESLAENLSDSVVAPLFYYALFGLPGAALYRLCNTLDSMIGYRGHYEYLGKASARLDDLLNLLPSRLTALLIISLAPFFGGKRCSAWQIWRRDAGKTASPNAGHPMSAAAGALGIQLEKVGHYTLGDNEKVVAHTDIKRAERMVWCVGGVAIMLCCILKVGLARKKKYFG
jgi:adenosylcobinamide-phosphate synthase